MEQPDDSPPRSLRVNRTTSMPLVPQSQTNPHPQQSSLTALSSYASQRRSPPVGSSQPQHVPPPNPQNFSTVHSQFHSHGDQSLDTPSRHTPPLGFPRPVQRVPPPPLLPPDTRLHNIRDDWTMTDQLLAEIDRADRAAHDQDASIVINIAGIGAGTGQPQHPGVPIPKGPIIERDRERVRDKKDSPREGEVAASGGSAGSALGRSGSLRQSSRVPQPPQPQANSDDPPRTPPHTQSGAGQSQRPLPIVPDRSQPVAPRSNEPSATYYPPMASPHAEVPLYSQSQTQQPRDSSPPFRYDERQQTGVPPSKTKTPDRSLPVQEENEAEEDVTITPSIERERARERDRQRELDMETIKERPRQMNHRLPTPQFSTSPMLPPDHIQPSETHSDVDLSSTVQGDDYREDNGVYENVHDGRSSRAGHRFDDEATHHLAKDDVRRQVDRTNVEAEDQDETESYTPRSHHANLPLIAGNNGGQNTERVVYNASQLHFRPRTASSDAGGMVNLDAAMIHDAIERLQQPYLPDHNHSPIGMRGPQIPQQFDGHRLESPFINSHGHGPHTALPQRVPTADEIRAMVSDSRAYDAWRHAHSLIRPGAPIPPTPPNATTLSTLSYAPPSLSPPPPRSTPYPYSYPYQHLMHRAQDPQQLLQHMQQQQAQQMQLLANGMQTDSTFSPSSTPYPSYDYSPFLPEHFRRPNGMDDPSMSLRSSPSHLPVNLPLFTSQRRPHSKRKGLRRTRGSRELANKLPPRGESTEPRETSPESSDGEVEEGEFEEFNEMAAQLESSASSENVTTERGGDGGGHSVIGEDEEEWVDDDEDDEDDLLHLEYHPNFVVNPDKRRKRWELKWDALVKAVRTPPIILYSAVDICPTAVPSSGSPDGHNAVTSCRSNSWQDNVLSPLKIPPSYFIISKSTRTSPNQIIIQYAFRTASSCSRAFTPHVPRRTVRALHITKPIRRR